MLFLFGSGGFLTGSTIRGAIETGFFFVDIGVAAGEFDFLEEEISTRGATLAVFRSTFFGAAGVDCMGLLAVAMCAVRTSQMSHGMVVMLLGCV